MGKSGVVVLAAGAVLGALLPAVAVAAPAVPVAPAQVAAPDEPVALGVIVQGPVSEDALVEAVTDALPGGTGVEQARGGPGGLSLVQFDDVVDGDVAAQVAEEVQERADVTRAVPNYLVRAFGTSPVSTDDPFFARQRNLWDAQISTPNGGYSVKAPAFWGTTRGTADTVVAVVDTGVLAGHPDLQGQLVPGYDLVDDEFTCGDEFCTGRETFYNAGDGDGLDADASDPGDWLDSAYAKKCKVPSSAIASSSWHGTHVAGIIAAKADNGYGTAGVAPGVRVQPVRVLGHCGGTTWDTLLGILWASGADLEQETDDPYYAEVGINPTPASVINLSLGSTMRTTAERREACDVYAPVLKIARGLGATIVAASGNDSFTRNVSANLSVPAACPGVVSVGATSRTGHRAYYSQAGSTVDVSAPGGDEVLDATSSSDRGSIWSTLNDGKKSPTTHSIRQYEGTSMATPHVAGAAALLYSLGATDPAKVEATLAAAVAPFPARSKKFAAVKVRSGSKTFTLADLNCTTSTCGKGVLDLSKLNTRSTGSATVGRTVTAQGWRTARNDATYAWRVEGEEAVLGTGRSVVVPLSALGRRLTVTVTANGTSDVARTAAVGRSTTSTKISIASKVKRTSRPTLKVTVSAPVAATGTVQVYDGSKRLASKRLVTSAKGRLTFVLPKFAKGKHRIRAVYSGDASLLRSTSSTRTVTSK